MIDGSKDTTRRVPGVEAQRCARTAAERGQQSLSGTVGRTHTAAASTQGGATDSQDRSTDTDTGHEKGAEKRGAVCFAQS